MGLNNITLTDYDTVVAVTQGAINATLATYLYGLEKQVGLFYNVDNNGNFVTAPDPETAEYSFTGTLDYTLDQNQNPVNLVQLNSGKGRQTVLYNITFSNARFQSKMPPAFDITQPDGGVPWVIAFEVNLKRAPVQLSSLSADVQHTLSQTTKSLGPDMFSIQQLYADLNTAVFASFQNITGMSSFAGALLSAIMQKYLSGLQESGGLIFGYSILALEGPSLPPTFMPTAFDFCVSPYRDSNGEDNHPELDTLNYLVMTGRRPLPAGLPEFGFNFVDYNSQTPSPQGAMAIRGGLYCAFLVGQLNPLLKHVCPVIQVKAVNGTPETQKIWLDPGADHVFESFVPPDASVLAIYSYTSQAHNATSGVGWSTRISAKYISVTQVYAAGTIVGITGPISVSADILVSEGLISPSTSGFDMPQQTYSWSCQFLLEMNPDANKIGQLNYKLHQFQVIPPPDPPKNQPWYTVIDPGNVLENLQSNVLDSLKDLLTEEVNTANSFVFPGGATFVFKNPAFSASEDLVANITYMTPS